MNTRLGTQSYPVAIADGFITKGETTIVMQCHDRTFQRITVFDEASEIIFTGESKGIGSLSWRRTIKDAFGNHIFDLRKYFNYAIKNKWVVETPSGREICCLRHISLKQRSAFDAVVQNEADKGNEETVEVRPKDQSALTTMVNIKCEPVAEIQNTEANDVVRLNGLNRSVWKARVAGGVDLALIVAIMLCRAEMQHTWKE